ncbi:MAG: FixH family protein [Actinoallomurus sp.]
MTSSPTAGAVAPARRSHRVVLALAVVTAALIVVWMMWPRPHEHVVLHAGTARYVVTATVGSSRVGTTAIDLDLTSRQGGPVDGATVTIAAIMPLMGQAAQPVPAAFSGHGHYRAAPVSLTMAGPWELRLSVDAPDGADHLAVPLIVSG